MDHCSCCSESQRLAEDNRLHNKILLEKVRDLERKNTALEEETAKQERRIDDLHDEVSQAEAVAEEVQRAEVALFASVRKAKERDLGMLRRLEFCLHGLCPVCLGVVEHKTGCDLKLAIWRIDSELHRSEFVLL